MNFLDFLLKNHESRVENLHKVKMSLTSKYQLFKWYFFVRHFSWTSLILNQIVDIDSTLGSTPTLWALPKGFQMTICVVFSRNKKNSQIITMIGIFLKTFTRKSRFEIRIAWSRNYNGLSKLKMRSSLSMIPSFFWYNKCVGF